MEKINLLVFLFGIAVSGQVLAQDCPRGMVDDPYPGKCGMYTDSNNDNICDHSQNLAAVVQDIPSGEVDSVIPAPAIENSIGSRGSDSADGRAAKEYYMWQAALAVGAAYLLSMALVRRKYLSVAANRKIWNLILLALFLFTAATSIFLMLRLDYGITASFPFDVAYWHVEIGFIMLLVSICHVLWHIPYFKSCFNLKNR